MRRVLRTLGCGLCALLMACAPTQPAEAETTSLDGTIVLWHYWRGGDQALLEDMIDRFEAVHPGVQVITAAFSIDEIEAEFADKTRSGIGPDLILVPNNMAGPLSRQRLVQNVGQLGFDLGTFAEPALATLRYDGQLYGLPLTLDTYALYYNRRTIDSPATTLGELLEAAGSGQLVTLRSTFFGGSWGIGGFGGSVQDDSGQITLDHDSFVLWLGWMLRALEQPNFVFEEDGATARELFSSGRAAYFTGNTRDLAAFREALGDDLGVALLPSGPAGPAKPYLETEALLFSTASSNEQTTRALALANFMTTPEQQRRFLRELGRIPSNTLVRIDPTATPETATFLEQTQSTIPFLGFESTRELVFGQGRHIYTLVLEGAISPENLY